MIAWLQSCHAPRCKVLGCRDACATTAVVHTYAHTHTHPHTPSVTLTHSLFQFAVVERLYVYYSQSQLTSQTVDLCVSFWTLVVVHSVGRFMPGFLARLRSHLGLKIDNTIFLLLCKYCFEMQTTAYM